MSGPPPGRKGHQRALSSVGNAAALFGAPSGGDNDSSPHHAPQHHPQQQPGDFFNSYGGSPAHSQGSPYNEHGIDTVIEEDEPDPSPDLGRKAAFSSNNDSSNLFGQQNDVDTDAWLGGGGGGGNEQQQQYSQEQYNYDYSQQQQQGGAAAAGYDAHDASGYTPAANSQQYDQYGAQHQQQGDDTNDPNSVEAAFDPPYYPGFVFDVASQTYLPDPAAQAAAQEGWGDNDEDGWGVGYDEQQQQHDPTAGQPAATAQETAPAPAAQHQQSEAEQYAAWEQQQQQQQQAAPEHTTQYNQQQPEQQQEESWDQYAQDQDPYAQQQGSDPYGYSSTQPDVNADPYAQQQTAEDYSQYNNGYDQSQDAYGQPQQPAASNAYGAAAPAQSGYAPPPQQSQAAAPSSYAPAPQANVYDPYAQQQANYGQQSGYDAYGQQQQQGYDQSNYGQQGYEPQQAAPYDPYAPQSATNPYAPQQPVAADPYSTARSPPTQYQQPPPPAPAPAPVVSSPPPPPRATFSPPPRTSSVGSSRAPPRRASVATGAVAPPPRTGSAASNTSAVAPPPRSNSAASNAVPPPPRTSSAAGTTSQVAPPPRSGSAASNVAPPPRSGSAAGSARAAPPASTAPPPRSNSVSSATSSAAPPPPRTTAPPSRTGSAQSNYAAPPPTRAPAAQPTYQQSPPPQPVQPQEPGPQQPLTSSPPPTNAAVPAPTPYSPPPASRKGYATFAPPPPNVPSTSASRPPAATRAPPPVMPPRQRAQHVRGASAFGSDSPYATLPTDMPPGPLSSMAQTTAVPEPEKPQQQQGYAPTPPSALHRAGPKEPQAPYGSQTAYGTQQPAYGQQQQQQQAPSKEPPANAYDYSRPWEAATSPTSAAPPPPVFQQPVAPAPPPIASAPVAARPPPAASKPRAAPRYAPPPGVGAPPPTRAAAPQARTGPPPMAAGRVPPPPSVAAATPPPPPPPQQASAPPPPPQSNAAPPPPRSRYGPPPPTTTGPPPRFQPPPPSVVTSPPKQVAQLPPPPPAPPVVVAPAPEEEQHYEQEPEVEEEVEQLDEKPSVPELNFEAPSPEVRPQESYDEEQPVEEAQVFDEQTAADYDEEGGNVFTEEEQGETDDYFEQQLDGSSASAMATTPPASRSTGAAQQTSQDGEYGFDDSQVFGDGGMSASTSGSTYGEWTGQSEAQQGYDYVGNGIKQEELDDEEGVYDPYATGQGQELGGEEGAYDEPSPALEEQQHDPYGAQQQQQDPYAAHQQQPPRDAVFTPPPPQSTASSTFGSPVKPSIYDSPAANSQYHTSPEQQQQAYGQPAQQDAYTYGAPAPPPSAPVDSYATYPSQQQHYGVPSSSSSLPPGPYSARADGNMTAPATYGSYGEQQQQQHQPPAAYSPYGSSTPSYDPYSQQQHQSKTLHRQMSTSSFVSSNAAPADLGLDRSIAPIVSFGFGGRLVLAFPNGGQQSSYGAYGATPSASSSTASASTVHIRKLDDLVGVPEATVFPGPMYLDGGKANAGKKRKDAVGWLDGRIEELKKEVAYVKGAGASAFGGGDGLGEKRKKMETRLILVKLVKVLVENEGKLTGSPKIDESVRAILAPQAALADIPDVLPTASQLAAFVTPSSATPSNADIPFVNYSVKPSNLDEISKHLMRGERRQAVKYALDHKMWAHAFIISSCVDTDCWTDVVMEFLRSELTPASGGADGREGLRVAYSMFAGLGADSIHQFAPLVNLTPALLSPVRLPTQLPSVHGHSPTPNLPERGINKNLPESVLDKWQETVAMIVSNRTQGDSAALTALGDSLAANGWLDAAHVCYLLSPGTSPFGGVGFPGARIVLLGSSPPTLASTDAVELESVMLTELVEFAFSLAPTVKGQEPFVGFPHLQAFRLHHAARMADAGHVSQALRYTEAIVSTLKLATKPSPFYTPALVASVKALADRLSAAPGQDKAGSWIARMVPRGPTKETLWSTLEGGFTKFVAGEGEPNAKALAAKAEVAKNANGGMIGPFSHYSSISPGSTSGTLSRTASQSDLTGPTLHPPSRPASAASTAPTGLQHSPGPPPVKRAPFKTHHSRSSSLGIAGYNYDPNAPPPWQTYVAPATDATPRASAQEFSAPASNPYGGGNGYDGQQQQQANGGGGWYGADQQQVPDNGGGLRAPAFAAVEQDFAEDESGFISPMAHLTPSVSPAPATGRPGYGANVKHTRTTTLDELEDLGIGNTKSRKPGFDSIDEQAGEGEEGVTTPTSATDNKRPPLATQPKADEQTIKAQPSKSWLGGWFKREASPSNNGPGPIRAKLGEEMTLKWDPELKRYINPKADNSGGGALATAPPPRAATASPSRSNRNNFPSRFQSETPPPIPRAGGPSGAGGIPPPPLNRSATTNDLRAAGQFRSASAASALPPPPRPSSAARRPTPPPPGMGGGGGPPPPPMRGGVGGAAAKRKMKPRYVAIS